MLDLRPVSGYPQSIMLFLCRLSVSIFGGAAIGLFVAALFLPIYSMFDNRGPSCFALGLSECISTIPMSALIYGPIFSIAGAVTCAPFILAWLASR